MNDFSIPVFPHQQKYYSFFSSYFDLTTTDPRYMVVPIDDHGFHRGDGVFEAIKWKGNKIWLLDKHLERLFISAKHIHLNIPYTFDQMQKKINELVSLANKNSGMIRIYVTRGPGNFGVSPKDTVGSQIYIMTTELKEVPEKTQQEGVKLGWSQIKPKAGLFAQAKTLNYMQNVLMKKECEDRGLDFVIGIGEDGFVTESYTENIVCLVGDTLFFPPFEGILRGTTLLRFMELIGQRNLKSLAKKMSPNELLQAEAIFAIGTTIDILWVNSLDGKTFKKPERYDEFRKCLVEDQS